MEVFTMEGSNYTCSGGGVIGLRKSMEDRIILFKYENMSVFGVFDGHSGSQISTFLKNIFYILIVERIYPVIDRDENIINNVVVDLFCQIDSEMKSKGMMGGSTALILILTNERYICINLGDSRCILSRKNLNNSPELFFNYNNKKLIQPYHSPRTDHFYRKYCKKEENLCIPLSFDHKPERELQRIIAAGGDVSKNRILFGNNYISMSRSFGDFTFKQNANLSQENQMVSCIPEIIVKEIENNDDFIVLATDGLFDVMSNNNVISYITQNFQKSKDLNQVLVDIVHKSINTLTTTDNVSVIILKLFVNNKITEDRKGTEV